jgi:LPXTG-motif cell wall-anchored protein
VTTAYLNEGTFTLSEIRTPTGYAALDEPITITVSSQQPPSYDLTVPAGSTTYYISLSGPEGFYTSVPAAGSSMARINVKNRTVQDLKVVKVGNDGGTRIPLEGVHFALYAQVKDNEGNVRPAYSPETGYEDLVTGDDGLLSGINMSLGAGTYYLREKAAPSGYKNLSEDLCFTIGQDGTVTIHNAGYSDWLTRDTSVLGTVAYQISIVNTPLGITLRKTDEGGTPLSGAGFTLCSKNSSGSFISVTGHGAGEGGLVDLTDKTETTFTGLPGGIYLLTETDPPAGCVILTKDIYFKVENGAVTLTDQDGNARTYSGVSLEDDGTTIVVQNPHGGALPHTGGPGTGIFTILGSVLTAGAGWLLWRRRKLI